MEGTGHDVIESITQHFPEETEENYDGLVRVARVPADLGTENLRDTNLED